MRAFRNSLLLLAILPFNASTAAAGLVTTANAGVAIPSLAVESLNLSESGNSGYSIGGSLGFRLGDVVQWDIAEFAYQSADQSDITIGRYTSSALSIGTGMRVGMFGEGAVHPYVSYGIGGARLDFERIGIDFISEWGFEWNVGAGLLIDLNDSVSMGARYRYRRSYLDEMFGIPISEITVGIHNVSLEILFGG